MTFDQWWDEYTKYIHFFDCREGCRRIAQAAWEAGMAGIDRWYKGYTITRRTETPDGQCGAWEFQHDEYGDEDRRHGFGATLQECEELIDCLKEEDR